MFRVGDKVRCIKLRANLTVGKEYTIVKVETIVTYNYVDVCSDNGQLRSYFEDRFELVTTSAAITTANNVNTTTNGVSTFKRGDLVRALNSAPGQYTKGTIYEVRFLYEDIVRTILDDKGSTTNGWGAENFELANNPLSQTSATKLCDCDLTGSNAWLGCRCGAFGNERKSA